MNFRRRMLIIVLLGASTCGVGAQDLKSPAAGEYVPRLGDIMSAAQVRHHKLWLAGQARNWALATFELQQLKASLVEAAVLYSGIPVSNVTTLEGPLQAASDAILAKDAGKFKKAIGELTDGCNACHGSMNRSFVVIKVPSDQSPFGNQVFGPPSKP
jgi:hypothetical protein